MHNAYDYAREDEERRLDAMTATNTHIHPMFHDLFQAMFDGHSLSRVVEKCVLGQCICQEPERFRKGFHCPIHPEGECPKCGSEDISRRHHPPDALGECYYKECNNCEHQWDHA